MMSAKREKFQFFISSSKLGKITPGLAHHAVGEALGVFPRRGLPEPENFFRQGALCENGLRLRVPYNLPVVAALSSYPAEGERSDLTHRLCSSDIGFAPGNAER